MTRQNGSASPKPLDLTPENQDDALLGVGSWPSNPGPYDDPLEELADIAKKALALMEQDARDKEEEKKKAEMERKNRDKEAEKKKSG